MIDRRHSRINEAKMMDWLRDCADRQLMAPSYPEIAERFGFETVAPARTLIAQLSDAGLIRIRPAEPDRFQFELTDRPRKQFTRNAFVRRQEDTKKPSARVQTIRQIAEGLAKRNEPKPEPIAPTVAPRIPIGAPKPIHEGSAQAPKPRVAPAGEGATPSPKVETKPTEYPAAARRPEDNAGTAREAPSASPSGDAHSGRGPLNGGGRKSAPSVPVPTSLDKLKAGLPAMEEPARDADMGNPIAVEMPGAAPPVMIPTLDQAGLELQQHVGVDATIVKVTAPIASITVVRPAAPADHGGERTAMVARPKKAAGRLPTRQVNMHIPLDLYDQIVKLRGPGEAGAAPTAVRLIRQAIEGIPAAVDASPEPKAEPLVHAGAMQHFVDAMQAAAKFLAALEREGIKL